MKGGIMKTSTILVLMLIVVGSPSSIPYAEILDNSLISLEPFVSDFQVNDNAGSAKQVSPVVAMDDSGAFMVAYQDNRNGDWDIYVQQFDNDGNSLGPEIRANDDEGVASQFQPVIASDADGNFVITWTDERLLEDNDIFMQCFQSDGNHIGVNVRVNDDVNEALQRNPAIAISSNGEFMIAWEDRRIGNRSIYAQRFTAQGESLGENMLVSDAPQCSSPTIGALDGGRYLAAWTDYRDGNFDVYAQWLENDGQAIGSAFKVNDDTGSARQFYPAIATGQGGHIVITWKDERSGSAIYAQRYISPGYVAGSNFKVNGKSAGSAPNYPAVAVDASGRFTIAWQASMGSVYNVYAQRFASNGTALGMNIKLNDDDTDFWQLAVSLGANAQGEMVAVWQDNRDLNDDIYGQRFAHEGTTIGANFRLFIKEGGSWQTMPAMAVDPNGRFVIAWEDERNGLSDIYARLYASDGNTLWPDINDCNMLGFDPNECNNVKVNDDQGLAQHVQPDVAMDNNGNFVIVWRDTRENGEANIYAQRYTSDGTALGVNFLVNDDPCGVTQYYPSVAMGNNGGFLITWRDQQRGHDDIYAQLYATDGSPQGVNFLVNDDPCEADQDRPCVSADDRGNFWIIWEDRRNENWDIYVQGLSRNGVPMGNNVKLNDDHGTASQSYPSIAAYGDGNFVAAWEDYRDGNDVVYACRVTDISNQVTNFKVSEEAEDIYPSGPSVAVGNRGEFVIAWYDNRQGDYDAYARLYSLDGIAYDPDVPLTDPSQKNQWYPEVKYRNNRIYSTWSDSRAGGTGFDIWANILEIQTIIILP